MRAPIPSIFYSELSPLFELRCFFSGFATSAGLHHLSLACRNLIHKHPTSQCATPIFLLSLHPPLPLSRLCHLSRFCCVSLVCRNPLRGKLTPLFAPPSSLLYPHFPCLSPCFTASLLLSGVQNLTTP